MIQVTLRVVLHLTWVMDLVWQFYIKSSNNNNPPQKKPKKQTSKQKKLQREDGQRPNLHANVRLIKRYISLWTSRGSAALQYLPVLTLTPQWNATRCVLENKWTDACDTCDASSPPALPHENLSRANETIEGEIFP